MISGRMKAETLVRMEFLSYEDPLGFSLAILAAIVSSLAAGMLGIFIKHKDTPVVKANNQTLSFILLLSLMFCSLCPLLFIGHPTEISCLLCYISFGTFFTVAISTLLAKTFIVTLAFRVVKPDRKVRGWLWKNMFMIVVLLCFCGEGLIGTTWLAHSPPFPDYNTKLEADKIILRCNEGSVIAFYVQIGYMGLLASFSFIVAFMARKLPDAFNEAQYITFSMLGFCSVWVSFIPAHLSTKGKYMVAVECFAILASSLGLLSCIFIPKCYIILIRPELNIRGSLIVKKQDKSIKI